jgi:hypothetical protein
MLEDPRINFAISTRTGTKGVDHLGLQVDDEFELNELRQQFEKADLSTFDEGETVCCYAQSDKSWLQDPAGVAWEVYKTMDDAQFYSGNIGASAPPDADKACCAPALKTRSSEKATACCG